MAVSTVPKNFTDASITISDDTPTTPLSLLVPMDQGDINLAGLMEDQRDVSAYQARGRLTGLRKGNKNFPSFSFTQQASDFSDGTDKILLDAIRKTGAWASAVSTTASIGDVLTYDVAIAIEGDDFGDAADHSITLEDVHFTVDFAEDDPDTFSVTGTVYGTITIT